MSSDGINESERRAIVSRALKLTGWLFLALILTVVLILLIGSACSSSQELWVLRIALIVLTDALIWKIASASTGLKIDSPAHLAELVGEIHAGKAPIDELRRAGQRQQILALAIRSLFLELRQQKQAMTELHNEIGQRVSSRTEALERVVGSLRNRATRDAMTGLHNRRFMDEYLPQLVEECRKNGAQLALLMIDVDYFKDLNDTLGHAAGDEMLRSLGQLITSTIREKDFAFRAGGDEFVIALVNCDKPGAMNIAHRLQSLTLTMTSAYRLPQSPRLSIGICTLGEVREQTAEALLRTADAALYAIKKARGSSRSAGPRHA